jgi:hypothetical protein
MPELVEMLRAEGLDDKDMDFHRSATWVVDEDGVKGFFSLRMEHNMPYLVHFCVKRADRCHALARRLVMAFKNVVKSLGYGKAIINTPTENDFLNRLVSRYFKARPYSTDGVVKFYLAEV